MSIQFQSALYGTTLDAHVAAAVAWLGADGLNSNREILFALAESSDAELAAECEDAWGMVNHNWYTSEELTKAFAAVRSDPPAAFDWDDDE